MNKIQFSIITPMHFSSSYKNSTDKLFTLFTDTVVLWYCTVSCFTSKNNGYFTSENKWALILTLTMRVTLSLPSAISKLHNLESRQCNSPHCCLWRREVEFSDLLPSHCYAATHPQLFTIIFKSLVGLLQLLWYFITILTNQPNFWKYCLTSFINQENIQS